MVPTHASLAFGIWLAAGAIIGDHFPFSTVDMYAGVAQERRVETAVPIVLVDGVPGSIEDFVGFQGEAPDAIGFEYRCRPRTGCKSFPSSMPDDTWIRTWVENHWDPSTTGTTKIQFGYQTVRATESGFEPGEIEVVWEGSASPKGTGWRR